MADNYLENKMEEHRARAAAPRTASAGSRKGVLSFRFPARRVLVTGGASGIGREIVKEFSEAGCRVAFFDVDEAAGRETQRLLGARFYHLDMADFDAIEKALDALISAWGDIDIVVNNVGYFSCRPIEEFSVEEFDRQMDVNLRPVFVIARRIAICRRSLPYPNPFGGRIINIASTRHIMSEPDTPGYSASKGAMVSLTHSLMMSLAPLHITVNSISPGWIHTGDCSELTEADHAQHPSRRVGRPDDIARLCLFLSLPDNDFINGTDIPVDGGMTRRMIYES